MGTAEASIALEEDSRVGSIVLLGRRTAMNSDDALQRMHGGWMDGWVCSIIEKACIQILFHFKS